jgi:hypothetical protein
MTQQITHSKTPSIAAAHPLFWAQSSAHTHKFVKGFGEQYIFKFPNRFKKSSRTYWRFCCIPVIPEKGLCGGMSLAVKTYFTYNKFAPGVPYPNDELLEFIARCQLDTLTFSALFNYFAYMLTSQEKDRQIVKKAWLEIKESIDQNNPIIVGLICEKARCFKFFPGVFKHHQILVYGYEIENGTVYLRLYDPKHPTEKNIKLFFKEDGSCLGCTDMLKRLYRQEDDFTKEPQLLPQKRTIYTFFCVHCEVSKETLQHLPIQEDEK